MELIQKNHKGWIEIVEAFVAILLVAGVVLFILNKSSMSNADISQQVYTTELSILREIETNDAFRAEIIATPDSKLPELLSSDNQLLNIQTLINNRVPNYLICQGQLCKYDDNACNFIGIKPQKDVYAQSVLISSTLKTLRYVQLKIFCWTK